MLCELVELAEFASKLIGRNSRQTFQLKLKLKVFFIKILSHPIKLLLKTLVLNSHELSQKSM